MVEATKAEPAEVGSDWRRGDGHLDSKEYARKITFRTGFVRVRGDNNEETSSARATGEEKTLDVPANHTCELLGNVTYKFVECENPLGSA